MPCDTMLSILVYIQGLKYQNSMIAGIILGCSHHLDIYGIKTQMIDIQSVAISVP